MIFNLDLQLASESPYVRGEGVHLATLELTLFDAGDPCLGHPHLLGDLDLGGV